MIFKKDALRLKKIKGILNFSFKQQKCNESAWIKKSQNKLSYPEIFKKSKYSE